MIHGTTSMYWNYKCRCLKCAIAASEYRKMRRARLAQGAYAGTLVPIEKVREHLQKFADFGFAQEVLAKQTGLGVHTIRSILIGALQANGKPAKYVQKVTADRVLNLKIKWDRIEPTSLVSARGFRRRYEALALKGYTAYQLAPMLNCTRNDFQVRVHNKKIEVKHHLRMVELYERLIHTRRIPKNAYERGAIKRVQNFAKSRGWRGALDWFDIDFDSDDAPGFDNPDEMQ